MDHYDPATRSCRHPRNRISGGCNPHSRGASVACGRTKDPARHRGKCRAGPGERHLFFSFSLNRNGSCLPECPSHWPTLVHAAHLRAACALAQHRRRSPQQGGQQRTGCVEHEECGSPVQGSSKHRSSKVGGMSSTSSVAPPSRAAASIAGSSTNAEASASVDDCTKGGVCVWGDGACYEGGLKDGQQQTSPPQTWAGNFVPSPAQMPHQLFMQCSVLACAGRGRF